VSYVGSYNIYTLFFYDYYNNAVENQVQASIISKCIILIKKLNHLLEETNNDVVLKINNNLPLVPFKCILLLLACINHRIV